MAYDNANTGILARNERKRPDKKDPDFSGQCEVGGVQYWLSAWVKEAGPQAKNPGSRFFSLSFKPKDGQVAGAPKAAPPARTASAAPPPRAAPAPVSENLEGDVPF